MAVNLHTAYVVSSDAAMTLTAVFLLPACSCLVPTLMSEEVGMFAKAHVKIYPLVF